jgi:zinc transport system substrate-binding protein
MLSASADGAAEPASGTDQRDPHTWLDPTNMARIAEHVRDALTEARPAEAAAFAANTTKLLADLDALDAGIKADLTGCRIQPFVTSHAAFGYLAERYGLTQVGIRGLEPDVEPSAARLAEVQAIVRDKHVTTIFFEALVSPVVSQSVANDLGLKTDVLDPLEGITADSRGSDYLEVMRANANSLKVANQCY